MAEGGALLRRYGGELLHRGFESLLLRFDRNTKARVRGPSRSHRSGAATASAWRGLCPRKAARRRDFADVAVWFSSGLGEPVEAVAEAETIAAFNGLRVLRQARDEGACRPMTWIRPMAGRGRHPKYAPLQPGSTVLGWALHLVRATRWIQATLPSARRGGRAVECGGLENRCPS